MCDRGVQIGHMLLAVSQQLHRVQSVGGRVRLCLRGREEARLRGVQSRRHPAPPPRLRHVGQAQQGGHVPAGAHRVSDEGARAHRHQSRWHRLQDPVHVVDPVDRGGHAAQSGYDTRRAGPLRWPGDSGR